MKYGDVILEAVEGVEYWDKNKKQPKHAVKVLVGDVWGHMARRSVKGRDLGVLFFDTGVERDKYMVRLWYTFGRKPEIESKPAPPKKRYRAVLKQKVKP